MLFASIPFLYYFLPCTAAFYALIPKKGRNFLLLSASLFFYAWGEPILVWVMALTMIQVYVFGILVEKDRGSRWSLVWGTTSVFLSLAVLGYYKYAGKTALPIGISFYTFQAISYITDVCRGQVHAQRKFVNLAAYITMFPQLIAGPIVRYADISGQLKERTHTIDKIAYGIERFLIGLGKKVLLANQFGELVAAFKSSGEKSVLFVWLYAVAYTLQIYFDFSGYSDMAIGLGGMFGFELPENFRYPYISGSITEFWRRWHISLGTWFRDYLYIPLGGNRVAGWRHFCNILLVWAATGLWHGAAWNFVLWGLLYGMILILEKYMLLKILPAMGIWRHVYVMLLVIIGFVIFDAADMRQALGTVSALFGLSSLPFVSTEGLYYLKSYGWLITIAAIGATPLPAWLIKCMEQGSGKKVVERMLKPLFFAAVLLGVTAFLVDGSYNPFLYFRF